MKKIRSFNERDIYKKNLYHEYPILVNADKMQYARRRMLRIIKNVFEATRKWHKVFFMRYDLRFPDGFNEHLPEEDRPHLSNEIVSEFQADFIKALKRKKYRPLYVLVREQCQSSSQHYHGILLLDGQKVEDIAIPIAIAERIWHYKLGLPPPPPRNQEEDEAFCRKHLVDNCMKSRTGPVKNGIMIRKDDPEWRTKRMECFKRASYLAKVNTKGHTTDEIREIFSSRIALRPSKAIVTGHEKISFPPEDSSPSIAAAIINPQFMNSP